jgi:hypothetical protein
VADFAVLPVFFLIGRPTFKDDDGGGAFFVGGVVTPEPTIGNFEDVEMFNVNVSLGWRTILILFFFISVFF